VLIPIGVASKEWLTPMTVADCRREIERRSSALIGMQVYDTDALSAISALRLRVRFRPWWQLHQASELVVYLRSETARSKTAVRVEAGLRVGVVISLLVWTGFLLIPIFVFQTLETRIFFGVVLVLPWISVALNARLQIRSAMRRLHTALPDAPRDGRPADGGGVWV